MRTLLMLEPYLRSHWYTICCFGTRSLPERFSYQVLTFLLRSINATMLFYVVFIHFIVFHHGSYLCTLNNTWFKGNWRPLLETLISRNNTLQHCFNRSALHLKIRLPDWPKFKFFVCLPSWPPHWLCTWPPHWIPTLNFEFVMMPRPPIG